MSHGDASDENAAEDRLWRGWQPPPHVPQTAGDMIMCRCGRRAASRHPFALSRRLGMTTVCGCGWCTVGFSNHPMEFLGGVPTFRQVWTLPSLSQRPLPESNLECPRLTDTTTGSNNKIFVFQEDPGPPSGDLSRFTSVSLTDHNLSNDSAIPRPTVSFHNALPDSNRSQGSHTSPSWSFSRMDSPVSSLIEPINQPSSYVIRRLVTDLPTDYDLHHII